MAVTSTAATKALRLQKKSLGNQLKTIKDLDTRLRKRQSAIEALATELDRDIKGIEKIRKELDSAIKSLEDTDRIGNFEIQKSL